MISIIVPVTAPLEALDRCLLALAQQDRPRSSYEVIVVAPDSPAEMVSTCERHGATLVQQDGEGVAAARNAGLRVARGNVVLFTEADCEPAPDWVTAMAAAFEDGDVVGAKGVYRTRQRTAVPRLIQLEYQDRYDRMSREPRIDFIDTYSAGYRRDVLLSHQGFDDAFPFLGDQELSFRLAQRGYRMVFQPEAVVFHAHNRSIWDYFRRKFIIGFWKAQVGRRYPEQLLNDSHTPQVVKVQMGMLGLACLLALVGMLWLPASVWAGALLATFLLTTMPFTRKALGRDRPVALMAPFFLLVRALALGAGFASGLVRPQGGVRDGLELGIEGWAYWVKRGMDLLGGLIGLIPTLIVWPFVALAIKLESPGPVIFRQVRIGARGRPFTIFKFRTMVADAEAKLDDLVDLKTLESPAFKLQNDPRVTRVGRFLRRTSLDELPQFLNVLLGDMSLVGPRPEEARVVALYTDWHRRRLAVKPGITGPMQVNGRGNLSLEERLALEIAYIERYSPWLDIRILWLTIPAVLGGHGAR